MAGFWSITNRSNAGSPATATQAAPVSTGAGLQLRLRGLEASVAGVAAGSDQLVVRDGATGVGTVLWSMDLSVGANAVSAILSLPDLDIRASVGNALTVEFVSGIGSDRENVNAQGDLIPVGWPLGMP